MRSEYSEEIGELLVSLDNDGHGSQRFKEEVRNYFGMDVPERTLRRWRNKAHEDGLQGVVPSQVHIDDDSDKARENVFYASLDDILNRSANKAMQIVIPNDIHFPNHCPRSIDLMLQITSDLTNPQIVQRGSDEWENANTGRWETTVREASKDYTLRTMSLSFAFSAAIEEAIGYKPLMPFIAGNHDVRFSHFVQDKAPQVQDYFMAHILGDIEKAGLHFMGWKTDGWEIGDLFASIHGHRASKFTADKLLWDYHHRVVIQGHVHRMQRFGKSTKSIRDDHANDRVGYTTACLCDITNVHYKKRNSVSSNWQNGMAIATVIPSSDYVHVDNLHFQQDGNRLVTVFGGKVYRSSKDGWQA